MRWYLLIQQSIKMWIKWFSQVWSSMDYTTRQSHCTRLTGRWIAKYNSVPGSKLIAVFFFFRLFIPSLLCSFFLMHSLSPHALSLSSIIALSVLPCHCCVFIRIVISSYQYTSSSSSSISSYKRICLDIAWCKKMINIFKISCKEEENGICSL